MSDIELRDVYLARKRISPVAYRTPLIASATLSSLVDAQVYLKPEYHQKTGSFKIRGAANKILSLSEAERSRGVITASTGNHGRAVAFVALAFGVGATVCLSEGVPKNKVEALRELGAEVVIFGQNQDDAFEKAAELQEKHGQVLIPPFDDAAIIAGQGTIGLEIIEDLPTVDQILVPVSGGGLISGIARTAKAMSPDIEVVGVSMQRAPVMYHSLLAGKPVRMREEETLADSLRGGIGLDNRYTFQMVQKYVDQIVLVSEKEIAEAMRFALRQHHIVLEGAGAVGIAALLHRKVEVVKKRVAAVLSGGNADMRILLGMLEEDRRLA
jgi:threonine dehydratase